MRPMERFALEIIETARIMRRDFDRRATVLGATRAQWRVLAKLSQRDGQRQIELADALDVEPISLCRMVDRLEEAGFVERRRDEVDRRAWRIHLTPKAAPVIAEIEAQIDIFQADMLAGISNEDRAVASRVLGLVRDNIGAVQTKVAVS
jgi:MarR family transcriptional regulator, transcriptional regulator for hemolysin